MKVTQTPLASWWKLVAAFVAGGLVGAMSIIQVVPQSALEDQGPGARPKGDSTEQEIGGDSDFDSLIQEGTAPGSSSRSESITGSRIRSSRPGVPNPAGLECKAGKNGGKTDVGISANRIRLATTVVRSGFGAAFLGEVEWGMEAVKEKVNKAGGICGRLIEIEYRDDKWDPVTGQQYLTNFMEGDYFAIPVGPSSEGLNKVIRDKAGGLDKYKVPVVGTDGMVVSQYTHPWVWPVAVSTASTARIMVIDAVQRRGITNADDFSIVFDRDYKFGQEAAEAFNDEVRAQTGQNVRGYPGPSDPYTCALLGGQRTHFCGIDANQGDYGSQVASFETKRFVAYFMDPTTALQWVYSPGYQIPGNKVAGAQPLFTSDFGNQCRQHCDGMMVWTGFRPYIESYKNEKALQTYVTDLGAVRPGADSSNQFTQGGYVGMLLFVDALSEVGPNLTRDNLRTVLDSMQLSSGLTVQDKLMWRTGNHFSAGAMQGFTMKYSATFSCCELGPIVADPNPKETESRLPDRVRT